jgi:hypothetical protein
MVLDSVEQSFPDRSTSMALPVSANSLDAVSVSDFGWLVERVVVGTLDRAGTGAN